MVGVHEQFCAGIVWQGDFQIGVADSALSKSAMEIMHEIGRPSTKKCKNGLVLYTRKNNMYKQTIELIYLTCM